MFKICRQELQYGRHRVYLETGAIARQADGAVVVGFDDTVVLATVVGKRDVVPGQNFLPLTVDYVEKSYSVGQIPGGFFKREGRASEKEILTARLIDRPIRPLFPEGFFNEVQVIVTVLSVDPDIDPDIPAVIAASAAVALSGVPFLNPIAACRIGFIDGHYVLNPSVSDIREKSQLDLVVAGTSDAVMMVESEASELTESVMLGAIMYGHEQMQPVINAIHDLVNDAGCPEWNWKAVEEPQGLFDKVSEFAKDKLKHAYSIPEKQLRVQSIKSIESDLVADLTDNNVDFVDEQMLHRMLFNLERDIVRSRILSGDVRVDGRDTRSVRPIDIKVSVLPRAHGSAIFTRGETQALAVTTLGTDGDAQIVDSLTGDGKDYFFLHYNMPPFATGETGRSGSPKRREIGHGRLARRALAAVLPDRKDFPYTIRVVSEITESNGSSSMASVCGGCLSLMDAGVPIKCHVAGVAMGLIKEGNKFAVLTDILGDEDHLGDMDFKVAGTVNGITALQMDMKIAGINKEIMEIALVQAKQGRLHILEIMKGAIVGHRDKLSDFAPRVLKIKINPEKIHVVIGKGGSNIKSLTEETKTTIDIQDDGTISISAVNLESVELAKSRIESLTADIEVNKVYAGKVVKIFDFGVVVDILPGRDGLLHVSQLPKSKGHNISIADMFTEGQVVKVKVIGFDEKNRPRLSAKDVD